LTFSHRTAAFCGLLLVATPLATGCSSDDDGDPFAEPLSISAPVAAGGGLVFHDEAGERLLRITGVDKPAISSFDYDGEPDLRAPTPDGKTLLMLDRDAWKLTSSDVAAGKNTDYKLPSEFSGFVMAADSKAAVVYHAAGGTGVGSLVNTAEVGLIDLTAAPATDTNPRVATITGLSRAPLRAHISPEIEAGGKHRVAWIDAPSMIGVADCAPGGKVRTIVIPLVAGESSTIISPARTVARVTGSMLDLYVIAVGSNDVLHIGIDLAAATLGATLDQIASGAVPADIHVFEGKDGLRVLTTNSKSRDLAVLDPSTGTGTYVHLESLTDWIVPYQSKSGAPMALLWRDGVYDFHIVDLDAVKKKKGKAVKRVRLDQPINAVAAHGDRFLLTHAGHVDRGLSLYDAAAGKQTVFGGTGLVKSVLVAGDAVFALGNVNGATRVSRIDIKDLHGTSISLKNRAAQKLLPYGDTGVAAVGPGLGSWWLAVFGEGVLKADKGVWLEGFALEGALR